MEKGMIVIVGTVAVIQNVMKEIHAEMIGVTVVMVVTGDVTEVETVMTKEEMIVGIHGIVAMGHHEVTVDGITETVVTVEGIEIKGEIEVVTAVTVVTDLEIVGDRLVILDVIVNQSEIVEIPLLLILDLPHVTCHQEMRLPHAVNLFEINYHPVMLVLGTDAKDLPHQPHVGSLSMHLLRVELLYEMRDHLSVCVHQLYLLLMDLLLILLVSHLLIREIPLCVTVETYLLETISVEGLLVIFHLVLVTLQVVATQKLDGMNHHSIDQMNGTIHLRSRMSIVVHILMINGKLSAKICHLGVRKWRKKVTMMIPVNVSHLQINFPSKGSLRRSPAVGSMVLDLLVLHLPLASLEVVMGKAEITEGFRHLAIVMEVQNRNLLCQADQVALLGSMLPLGLVDDQQVPQD